ncbi:MAG: hypothetical protein ACFB51_07035 [Anaerolineae bacterium]
MLIGGAAALTLGGGTALLVNNARRREPVEVVLPNGADVTGQSAQDIARLAARITELENELAAVAAERDQLISELSTVRTERDNLSAELQECMDQLALWEQHHNTGLDALVSAALATFAPLLSSLVLLALGLGQGIGDAQRAIDRFVQRLPGPQNGVKWLRTQTDRLGQRLDILADSVQDAVETAGSLVQRVSDFIIWVLDRLPFGAGEQASRGMQSMEAVVAMLPDMLDGLRADVLDPMLAWFDEGENVKTELFDPVSADVIQPAAATVEDVVSLNEKFEIEFEQPAEAALQQRAALMAEIEASAARLHAMRARRLA